jgi:hypothetical protein
MTRFFKDRAWLRLEFPELIAKTEANVSDTTPLPTLYVFSLIDRT